MPGKKPCKTIYRLGRLKDGKEKRWFRIIAYQPGFHFGKNGKDAPKDIVKKGFGRIQLGHSELSGHMSHTRALKEGARAASAAMKQI